MSVSLDVLDAAGEADLFCIYDEMMIRSARCLLGPNRLNPADSVLIDVVEPSARAFPPVTYGHLLYHYTLSRLKTCEAFVSQETISKRQSLDYECKGKVEQQFNKKMEIFQGDFGARDRLEESLVA